MDDVYVVGVGTTPFRRWVERDLRSLAAEAVGAALEDAAGARPAFVAFGSCTAYEWGQPSVRGPVVLAGHPGVPAHTPISTVEAGCATGVLALHAAAREVRAGADVAVAVGVDKTLLADRARIGPLFEGATDRLDPAGERAFVEAEAARLGLPFAPAPDRSVLLDVAALQWGAHALRHGTPVRALAAVVARSRRNAVANPNALLRTPLDADAVLAEAPVVGPFTRPMCAPLADGAAAAVLASGAWVRAHPGVRAVRLRGIGVAGGSARRALDGPSEAGPAASRAFADAGVGPGDLDFAEFHDATAFAELAALEAVGPWGPGEAAAAVLSGETAPGGRFPVNPSGGLLSRGHPLAATGLSMVHEVVTQLRGEAGARQLPVARRGLVHNAGGLLGFDHALCGVAILEA